MVNGGGSPERNCGQTSRATNQPVLASQPATIRNVRVREAIGLPAVGLLRQAERDPDVEIVRRAERCLQRIEKVPSTALSAAAARLVARRPPEGAAEVLLNYLPLADDETVADEVRDALAA